MRSLSAEKEMPNIIISQMTSDTKSLLTNNYFLLNELFWQKNYELHAWFLGKKSFFPGDFAIPENQRRRNDTINNICVLEGVGEGENLRKIVPKTLFFLGNSMTIKFGNFANFIVRNLVVIWEAPRKSIRKITLKDSLKTLSSLNKEVRPFFLGDDSIWSFPRFLPLSDHSIWRSWRLF